MMGSDFLVHFPGSGHPPVRLPRGPWLSQYLTPVNSPLLFGCRTGVCGTCLVAVTVVPGGVLAPPAEDEAELLSLICPGRADARLACQLDLTAHIGVEPISQAC